MREIYVAYGKLKKAKTEREYDLLKEASLFGPDKVENDLLANAVSACRDFISTLPDQARRDIKTIDDILESAQKEINFIRGIPNLSSPMKNIRRVMQR